MMASPADSAAAKSYEITIAKVTGLPRLLITKPVKAQVQIEAGSLSWKTQREKWENGGGMHWDEKNTLVLPPLSTSDELTLSLIRDHRIGFSSKSSKAEGSVAIGLAELLQKSDHRPNEDIVLSLQLKGKDTCKLTIWIAESSTTALDSAMEHVNLGLPAEETAPKISSLADTMSAAGGAVTGLAQSDLVGSFEMLLGKMYIMVTMGDEIAKIHPWVNLAWNVLSVGLKLVKAQQDRDDKIATLIQTMQSTYSIVVGSEILRDERLQDVLSRILKQTVDCGYFIQQYTRHGSFLGKAVTETLSGTDALIARYQDTFKKLGDEFMGRITTHTTLMTVNIATTVNEIRFDQLMEKLRPATMDQSERNACLPGTRLDAIKSIMDWYSEDSDSHESVMWLYGLTGAGKSTVSTTIARMMDHIDGVNLLGAFFFFNRALPDWNASTLIRTIAYQLAEFDSIIGAKIEQVIKEIPNIASQPLAVQFEKLLSAAALGHIPWSRGPILVVVDALDECGSQTDRAGLLRVISEGASKLPGFIRILIISRPEDDILYNFSHPLIRRVELRVDPETCRADIAMFIRSQLSNTRQRKVRLRDFLQGWPGEEDVNNLTSLAGGHFIWAVTACRLIDASHNPRSKMNELIEHQTDTSGNSFAKLYELYKTALQSAGPWDDPSFCTDVRDILGVVICAQIPLSCGAIGSLLGPCTPPLKSRLPVAHTISSFGSVLHWSKTDETLPIRILHTSFRDYLTLHDRGTSWAIDVEQCNAQLAHGCIALLESELRENMCNLVLKQPVQSEALSESVVYACRFWIEHVCLITNALDGLADMIDRFLRKHLLHWMEALVIIKNYNLATRSLVRLLKWTQRCFPGSKLCDFVLDAHRFAQYFANTIKEHPLLIYTSAVPFTPRDTLIYQTFHSDNMPHVVTGVEPAWPPLLQTIYGHEKSVYSVSFSPDGSQIVSGSHDYTVRVWDAVTGEAALPPLQGHAQGVWSVSFSPDGSQIASGSEDGTVRMWNAVTGNATLPPLQGHEGWVLSVSFSPDGSQIVSGSYDYTVRVWDTVTGEAALPPLQGHDGPVNSVSFSPDGSLIVSGSDDRTVRVWSAVTGKAALPPLQGHEAQVHSVLFSPDGSQIVSGSYDYTVRVWNAVTGQASLPPLEGHEYWVTSVSFSPDGSQIVSGSQDTTVRVWNAVTGEAASPPLEGHEGTVTSVSFSPDGSQIVSGSGDATVRVWDIVTDKAALPPLQGHNGPVRSVSLSPDESQIASGSEDGTVRVWNIVTGEAALPPLQGHAKRVWSVSFSPDGSQLASGSEDGTVRVWNAVTSKAALPPLQGHEGSVNSVSFSPDGSQIVSGSDDGTVRVWNANTGKAALPPLQGHEGWVLSVSFSPNGSQIVSGSYDRTVRVWNAATGQAVLPPLQGHADSVYSVSFSPDGSQIVSGSDDATLRVWNAITGEATLPPLQGHEDWVRSVSFSPDGSQIVSGSEDSTVRVWNAVTGDYLEANTCDAISSHGEAHFMMGLDEHRYFRDVNSGRYLGKIPTGFAFNTAACHGSRCVLWREVSSKLHVPVIIHFRTVY